MGATSFETTSRGKDLRTAYSNACQSATAEYGHQDGYNGTISTTDGAIDLTDLFPKGTTKTTKVKLARLAVFECEGPEVEYSVWSGPRVIKPVDPKQPCMKGLSPLHRSIVAAIASKRISKRGPCGAIKVSPSVWYFIGWAAC